MVGQTKNITTSHEVPTIQGQLHGLFHTIKGNVTIQINSPQFLLIISDRVLLGHPLSLLVQ